MHEAVAGSGGHCTRAERDGPPARARHPHHHTRTANASTLNATRAGAEAPARAQSPDQQAQPSTAALNHVVIDVGCVMAVPTMTANAPASMAAAACSGV